MKNLIKALSACLLLISGVQTQAQNIIAVNGKPNTKAHIESTRTTPREVEQEMLKEINLVRMNPKGYIQYVKDWSTRNWKSLTHPDIASLIDQLDKMKKITTPLKHSDCLYITARNHCIDQAPTGSIAHDSKKSGSPIDRIQYGCGINWNGNENIAGTSARNDARDINIILLVDQGISGHGHRKNILNPDWTHSASFFFYTKDDKIGNIWHWVQKFGEKAVLDKCPAKTEKSVHVISGNAGAMYLTDSRNGKKLRVDANCTCIHNNFWCEKAHLKSNTTTIRTTTPTITPTSTTATTTTTPSTSTNPVTSTFTSTTTTTPASSKPKPKDCGDFNKPYKPTQGQEAGNSTFYINGVKVSYDCYMYYYWKQ